MEVNLLATRRRCRQVWRLCCWPRVHHTASTAAAAAAAAATGQVHERRGLQPQRALHSGLVRVCSGVGGDHVRAAEPQAGQTAPTLWVRRGRDGELGRVGGGRSSRRGAVRVFMSIRGFFSLFFCVLPTLARELCQIVSLVRVCQHRPLQSDIAPSALDVTLSGTTCSPRGWLVAVV